MMVLVRMHVRVLDVRNIVNIWCWTFVFSAAYYSQPIAPTKVIIDSISFAIIIIPSLSSLCTHEHSCHGYSYRCL